MEKQGSSVFKKLKIGPIKRLYKYNTPESINFAGGLPLESTFPLEEIEVKTRDSRFTLTRGSTLHLNYLRGDGVVELRDWIHSHSAQVHAKNEGDFSSCMTAGSSDALAKIVTLLAGDSIIFDEYAYGTAVETCSTLGRRCIGVETDSSGMLPNSLKTQVLSARERGLNPDIVYLVPVAQNPTGVTMTVERKEEIYAACKELDLIIVEDDAYYYTYFDTLDNADNLTGVSSLPRSLFSMDTEGRVLRLDSLSKFICPGIRMGWVLGPADFVAKYQLLQEISTQFPSGFSQSIFLGLVKDWGEAGFSKQIQSIQLHYQRQCAVMVEALKGLLSPSDCEYVVPTGGMFIWLRLVCLTGKGLTSFDVFEALAQHGVIAVPGDDFHVAPMEEVHEGVRGAYVPCVRITFAAATHEQMRDGVRRLALGVEALKAKGTTST